MKMNHVDLIAQYYFSVSSQRDLQIHVTRQQVIVYFNALRPPWREVGGTACLVMSDK